MAKSTSTAEVGNGVTLYYETIGQPSSSRPSLVFHHYYGGSPATYKHVLSQPSIEPFHKILYHARGWFPSTGPSDSDAYGITALSSDLSTIISETGLLNHEAGFILIGHSMGGKVAQHHAATNPSPALKGLVLVAPAPLRGLNFPPDVKAQQRAAYQSAEGVRFVLENVLTARPGTLDREIMDQCVRDSMRGNEAATAAWPDYASAEDYEELEEKIRVPVLVLRGDKDFERDVVGEMGAELGWVQKTIEDCGHLFPLEKPKRLSDEIMQFVQGTCVDTEKNLGGRLPVSAALLSLGIED
ncbi:alpha/beta-hydrolase [Xylariaceae sp. AK1471]|nr:alpha/beta-hydrolase [Xylariaceae sp. AK1471]